MPTRSSAAAAASTSTRAPRRSAPAPAPAKAASATKRKRASTPTNEVPAQPATAATAAHPDPDASTTTPTTTTAEERKAAPKSAPVSRGRKKRASSVEPSPSAAHPEDESLPAIKRARRDSIASEAGSLASNATTASVRGRRPKGFVLPHQPRLGMNPLPRALPLLPSDALNTKSAGRLSTAALAFSDTTEKLLSTSTSNANGDATSNHLPRHLLVWGSADSGQLGLGPDVTDEIARPKIHQPLADAVAAGDSWSKNGIETAVAGGMHTLAIDTAGVLWSWGVNDNAALGRQCGRDPDIPVDVAESTPARIEGLSPDGHGINPKTGKEGAVTTFRATRIAATDCASVTISDVGELRCWGSFRSNEGLLGFESQEGASKMQYMPVAIPALSRHTFSAIASGENHFLALTTEGIIFAWGNGEQAQLGRKVLARRKLNALTPEKVGVKKVRLIGSGAYHSFAVDSSEVVWVWGLNMRHQTGLNLPQGDLIETPMMIPSLSRPHKDCKLPKGVTIVQITAGSAHSLFLLSNGEVWACGRSDGGEIGLADDHEVMKDIQAKKDEWKAERSKELEKEMEEWKTRMAEQKAEAAAANGNNPNGDAGTGFTFGAGAVASVDDLPPVMGAPPDEYVGIPTRVPFPSEEGVAGPTEIVQISCGSRFSMAVSSTGKLYAWGTGPSCELGLGPEEDMVVVPTVVRSVEFKKKGWVPVAVSAGGQHCVALAVNPGGDAAAAAS
ncbi:unnamed protein product [Tilletia controversa]|uniref:RCC1-like domain-containing protein n=1 Tax=Tilletia controversa TaxID=13291 RepID=A0A8X7SW64_9BASI|nr:hypothetical protein A4X06_0g5544 [Tilletia controversa]CAD6978932.1 unnamed protein product [Tilletia controversa]